MIVFINFAKTDSLSRHSFHIHVVGSHHCLRGWVRIPQEIGEARLWCAGEGISERSEWGRPCECGWHSPMAGIKGKPAENPLGVLLHFCQLGTG